MNRTLLLRPCGVVMAKAVIIVEERHLVLLETILFVCEPSRLRETDLGAR